ncbi:uncharacterized protein LOC126801669 [Argentina anserina]|uniref:uncharacterized protein LOC126801669 n=1 Tax=Argentina anserina TaxID=57926 RepID=UPI002176531F|nr:uncharacterized protein LOC126801669 [Potentilla anserina]
MTIFAGNLSSEGGDRSVVAPAEINAQELSKGSRIRYTRSYLVSLAKLSTGKGLPRGIEPSVLSELDDSWLDHPWEVSNDSDSESCQGNYQDRGLLSSENIGLLGVGSLRRVQGDIADASPPKVEENILSLLHKSKEPYRPPHLLKADWNDYKDEAWVSPEYLSKNGQKQNWGKDFPEVMKAGQKEALLQKKKKNSSERDKKVQPMMPLDMSENEEIMNSLAPENSDTTATHTKIAANCSEFAQFPAIGIVLLVN